MTLDPDPALRPQVVLHGEHLRVATTRRPTGRLVLRRVITTETRRVEVSVRGEELRPGSQPAHDPSDTGARAARRAASTELVLATVLSPGEPAVHPRTRPDEQASTHLDTTTERHQLCVALAREPAEARSADLNSEQPAP